MVNTIGLINMKRDTVSSGDAFSFQDGDWTLWIEDDEWFIFLNGWEWWRSGWEDTTKFLEALNRRIGRIK